MRVSNHLFHQASLYLLLGATVGLVVWAALNWTVYGLWHPSDGAGLAPERFSSVRMQSILLLYLPVGIILGAMVAILEPVRDTDFRTALRNEWSWLVRGIALGAVGAFLGGWLGEVVMEALTVEAAGAEGIRPWARLFGVVLFGLILGTALGMIDKWRTTSNDRLLAGIIGGSLGGGLAGVVFQFIVDSPEVMTVIALMIFASLVSAAIGSIGYLQTKAVLVGTQNNISKYQAGFRRPLNADASYFIGTGQPSRSSGKTNMKIFNDREVMKEHCTLEFDKKLRRWILARYQSSATELFVNYKRVGDRPVAVRDGDLITIGRQTFRFSLER